MATVGAIPEFQDAFDETFRASKRRSDMMKDPFTQCIAVVTTELIRRPEQFKAQELKDVLWSLSKVRSFAYTLMSV